MALLARHRPEYAGRTRQPCRRTTDSDRYKVVNCTWAQTRFPPFRELGTWQGNFRHRPTWPEHDVFGVTAFWLAAHSPNPASCGRCRLPRRAANRHGGRHDIADGGSRGAPPQKPDRPQNPAEDERLVLEAVRVATDAGDEGQCGGQQCVAHRRFETPGHCRPVACSGADLHALYDKGQTPLQVVGGPGGDDSSTVALLRRLGATDVP